MAYHIHIPRNEYSLGLEISSAKTSCSLYLKVRKLTTDFNGSGSSGSLSHTLISHWPVGCAIAFPPSHEFGKKWHIADARTHLPRTGLQHIVLSRDKSEGLISYEAT